MPFSSEIDEAEKTRKLIYGSLMLYGAETIPLRQRALEQAILAALVGSTAENPYKNGDIQQNLRAGIADIGLRPELIAETLAGLCFKEQIAKLEVRKKYAYYLTASGLAAVKRSTAETESLLEPVVAELLQHADELFDRNVVAALFKDFICSVFARFGHSIAAYLMGRYAQLGNATELAVVFRNVATKYNLEPAQQRSLSARCIFILKSKSSAVRRMMLHLTQGFCFAQLIGIDRDSFNPMAEEAFKDSVFYCDSNVLFAGLLPGDRGTTFAEVLGVAKRVGADIRVTRATIDETRFTAAEKLQTLHKFVEAVPEEVGELSSDELTAHFYEARQTNGALTPEEFIADFLDISSVVQNRWGLAVDEHTEESLLEGQETRQIEEIIQTATIGSRGYKKNDHVLKHDVALFVLVRSARKSTPKTWLLTRDRALINAAPSLAKLQDSDKGFCFGMLGFLQSLSPFVSSSSEEDSLANFFGALLADQVFISEKLFDDKELALMVETHADVMSMPADQVVMAADYIKKHVLKGEQYRSENVPAVALELRKFLSSNAEERRATLEARAAEVTARYEMVRRQMEIESGQRKAYQSQLARAEDDLAAKDLVIEQLESAAERRRLQSQKRKTFLVRLGTCVLLIGVGITIGALSGRLVQPLARTTKLTVHRAYVVVQLVKWGFLLSPMMLSIRQSRVSSSVKAVLLTTLLVGWALISGVAQSPLIGTLSNAIGVATTVAALILIMLRDADK